MTLHAKKMKVDQFEQVASQCKRWSDRSLSVAKALIVDGVALSEAAVTHAMSPQQANVIRGRFLAKAEDQHIEEFMRREKPKLASSALEPFASHMQTLRDKGYTIGQIVAFLKESGVSTSPTTVRTFLRRIQA